MDARVAKRHRKSQLATASLVLGLLGLALGFVTGLPAILLGHTARDHIRRNRVLTGRGKALAGMILGYVTTFASFALLVVLSEMLSSNRQAVSGSEVAGVEAQLARIAEKVELYREMGGSYPTTAQGLEALVNHPDGEPAPRRWKPHFRATPVDRWGRPYGYALKGASDLGIFTVFSRGPDGLAGTEDDITTTIYH